MLVYSTASYTTLLVDCAAISTFKSQARMKTRIFIQHRKQLVPTTAYGEVAHVRCPQLVDRGVVFTWYFMRAGKPADQPGLL